MSKRTPRTQGVHHAGLTVPDLAAARRFFEEALGFSVVGERPDYPAAFVSDGVVMLTLWRAEDPAAAIPFDRKKGIGVHHLALRPHLAPPQQTRLPPNPATALTTTATAPLTKTAP